MKAIMEYLLQHHREVPRAVPPLTRLIWEPATHLCSISFINFKLRKQLGASPSQTHLFPAPFTQHTSHFTAAPGWMAKRAETRERDV